MSTFYKINNIILDVSRISCVSKSTEDNELVVSMGNVNHVFSDKDAEDIFKFLGTQCLNYTEVEDEQDNVEFKDIIDAIKKANYFNEDYNKVYHAQVGNIDRAIKKAKKYIIDFETFYNTMKVCKMDYTMNTIALWINGRSSNVMTESKKIEELSSITECIKWWWKLGKLKPEKKVNYASKKEIRKELLKNFDLDSDNGFNKINKNLNFNPFKQEFE